MIYFVTETWLKTNTPVTANIDAVKIFPFVQSQSDMRMQPILGTYFYKHLLTAYNAQTLTLEEVTLVEKMQYAISWRAVEDCVLGISYALKNKGIQQQSGDYSQPVTFQEIAHIQNHYSQKAEFYERRVIEWLKANKDLYPEFTSTLNTDSDIKPTKVEDSGYNDFFTII
jgi:hypothetical protein